jgi:hypothetical protein
MAETITVTGPEGLSVQFPAGTSKDVINKVMTEAYNRKIGAKVEPQTDAEIGRDVIGRVGVGQGLMMGFGDEIAAYIRSTGGGTTRGRATAAAKARETGVQPPSYEQALAEERAGIAAAREQYPKSALAAELTGALAPAVATLGAAAPVTAARTGTLAGNIVRGAGYGMGVGAGTGAISGFGTAEGGAGNRALGATQGALIGGVTGGVLGAAVPAASGFAQSLFASPEKRAARWASSLLESENLTPAQVKADYAAAQAAGVKPEILADIYPGSGIARETQRLITYPGADRRTLTKDLYERAREQGPRITTEFEQALGTQQKIFPEFEALEKARRTNAAPLYAQAYPEQIRNKALDDLITRAPDEAFAEARKAARYEGLDFPDLVGTNRQGKRAVVFDYTVKDIDMLKRGLDDIIERNTDSITGKLNSEARRAVSLKDDILNAVDSQSPSYKMAREAWAGPSSVMSSMKKGQMLFNERSEITAKEIAKMTDSEKDGFLIGVLDAVNQKMANTAQLGSRDVAAKFLTGNAKDQIKAALRATNRTADEAEKLANQLIDNLEREYQMQMTTRLATPSATSPLAEQQQAFRATTGATTGFLSDLRSGGVSSALAGALQRGAERASLGLTQQTLERTNKALTPYFFGRSQPEVNTAMDILQRTAQEQGRYATQRNLVPGLIGGATNVLAGEINR